MSSGTHGTYGPPGGWQSQPGPPPFGQPPPMPPLSPPGPAGPAQRPASMALTIVTAVLAIILAGGWGFLGTATLVAYATDPKATAPSGIVAVVIGILLALVLLVGAFLLLARNMAGMIMAGIGGIAGAPLALLAGPIAPMLVLGSISSLIVAVLAFLPPVRDAMKTRRPMVPPPPPYGFPPGPPAW